VSVVLSYMLTTWPQHDRLDIARVGMFGFSLGGFTTLVVSGGTPDVSRMRELCTKHPTAPECLFIKERNGDQLSLEASADDWTHNRQVKAAVVVSPAVSYLVGPGSLKDVRIPVQLWRASNDDQVPDAWNTALILKELPTPPEEHVVWLVQGTTRSSLLAATPWPNRLHRSARTLRASTDTRSMMTSIEKLSSSSGERLPSSTW